MRRIYLPLCIFNRHAPTHNRAKWDGTHFTSKCRFCGKDIRRREKGFWQKDWCPPEGHAPDPAASS